MMHYRHFPEGRDNVVTGLRRGTLVKTDDSGTQQLLTVRGLASEQLDKIVRVLPHGFSSNAPADAEGIFLSLGGRSDRVFALGYEHKDHRKKNLPVGTAVLYDDKGNVIFAKSSDGIAVEAKSGKIYVKPADGQKLYLGGNGSDGTYGRVETDAGPSSIVYAKI